MQEPSILQPASLAPEEKVEILAEVGRIAGSKFFRTSSRYPLFLRYVVGRYLAGAQEELKERTIGIEVFHRAADYDTTSDPVVRVSAGEVRKRIAQFYQQYDAGGLRIEIPIGSYTPRISRLNATSESDDPNVSVFQPRDLRWRETSSSSGEPHDLPSVGAPRTGKGKSWWAVPLFCLCIAFMVLAIAAYRYRKVSSVGLSHSLFSPLLKQREVILICLADRNVAGSEAANQSVSALNTRHEQVPFSSVFASQQISRYISSKGGETDITAFSHLSYMELRDHPSILVGNLDNPWILRVLAPLPYRPQWNAGVISVNDSSQGGSRAWSVDTTLPLSRLRMDYAVIARLQDPDTHQTIIVVSGMTDRAAYAFGRILIFDPQMLESHDVDWAKPNVELIVSFKVVNGLGGLPHVEASKAW